MKYTYKTVDEEKNIADIEYIYDIEELKVARNRVYEETKGKYSIQGFRKGKVPKRVLENLYGENLFDEEALDILINEGVKEFLEKEDRSLKERPDVIDVTIGEGHLKCVIRFQLLKQKKIGKYKNRVVTLVKQKPSNIENEVDRQIENIRRELVRKINVDDRAVQLDDIVTIDFKGFFNDVPFEGGAAQNYDLKIGSGSFIPGFEDQIIEMKINEEKKIQVKFPSDYFKEDFRDKVAVFDTKLKAIKVEELPELNDDFIAEVSEVSNTVDEFRNEIKAKILKESAEIDKNKAVDKLLEIIIKDSVLEFSTLQIEDRIKERLKETCKEQGFNLEIDKFLEQAKTDNSYYSILEKNAIVELQRMVILFDLCEKEKLFPQDTKETFSEKKNLRAYYERMLKNFYSFIFNNNKVVFYKGQSIKKLHKGRKFLNKK